MTKLMSIIVGGALGLTLAASIGAGIAVGSNNEYKEAKAASTTISWTAGGSTTSGYSFVCTNGSDKTSYYQDKNGNTGLDVYLKKSSGALWTTAPTSVSLTAKVGGGSLKDPLTNNVTAYFVGSNYSTKLGSEVTVTTKVENKNGQDYTVSMTPQANAYGILIHHTKESGYNIRLYSFSLTYVVDDGTKYTVTYNDNGADSGSVPTDSTQYSYNASVTVKGNTGNLDRNGYTFSGWNTAADGSGTTYSANDTFNISSNTTLYAYWVSGRYDFTGDKLTFSQQNLTNAVAYEGTFTNNSSFTVNFTGGSTKAKYYNLGLGMRIYRNNGAVTINALNSKTITNVIFTWFDTYRPTENYFSLSSGSFVDNEYSIWSGSASTLTLTNTYTDAETNPWRLQAIAVQFSDTTISNPVLSGYPSCTNYSTAWDISNIKVNATVNNVVSDYTDRFNIIVNTALPTVTETTTMQVSVTATLKTDSSVTVTSTLTAHLDYRGETTIERLYYTPEGSLEGTYFYGIFMGYFTRISGSYTYYDYYLANGDYGIYIYGAYSEKTTSTTAPTYTPFETYLKVEGGYLSVYNNLFEISSYTGGTSYPITTTEITDPVEKAKVGVIRTYVVTGEEAGHTSEKAIQMTASRLALVEGKVKSVDGTISSTTAATVTITLSNGNDFPVYINKNVSSLDYTKLASALVVGNNVSVKGFTSIHNIDYQVVNPIDVEVEPEYTATEFAQYLLNSTNSICQAATDTNGPLLAPIWIDLEINKWPTLSASEKSTLALATANESGSVVQQAMARYDLICSRYGLTNFINRASANPSPRMNLIIDNNAVVVLTASLALLSTTAFAAFYMLRKKKLA